MTRHTAATTFWVLFALLAAGASVAARVPVIRDRPFCGYRDNDDAPAHVAATLLCYDETPARHHKYLPIITLGADSNKWEPAFRDAGGFDKRGNFYYTSFPPLAFAAPQLVRTLTGVEPTPQFVRWFSVGLHLLSAALLSALLWTLTRDIGAASVGSAAFLLMPECLKSFGVSYWAHQLYQPILFGQLWCLAAGRTGTPLRLLTALGCLTEWTAYLVAVALSAILIVQWRFLRDRRAIWDAVGAIGAAGVAGAGMVAWYASVLGLKPYFAALAKRAQTRAAMDASGDGPLHWLEQLESGYSDSLGWFLWLIPLAFLLPAITPGKPGRDRVRVFAYVSVALVSLAALGENLLMCQHAVVYTFARVKGCGAIALLIGAMAASSVVARWSLAGATLLAGVASLATGNGGMFREPEHYDDFRSTRYADLGTLVRRTCPENAVALTDDPVRGAEIYYARRNLIELPRLGDHAEPDVLAKLTPYLEHYCHVHRVGAAVAYQVRPESETIVVTRFDLPTKGVRQFVWRRGGVDPPTRGGL